MPANMARLGSAASLVRGRGGLPFCSGGNFRIGSAIALLLSWRVPRGVLNGVTHVFLDLLELSQKPVSVGRIDAFERGRGELGAQPAQLAEQRAGRLLQV